VEDAHPAERAHADREPTMKKRTVILEELLLGLRNRFTLTQEEKKGLLFILIIFWVGLLARTFYLKEQTREMQTPQGLKTFTMGNE